MKRPEAQLLARRIEAIWSPDRQWTHVRTDEWVDALERCEHNVANAAIDQLRNTHEKCPSMAEFMLLARPAHVSESHSIQCLCGGSGWIEITETDTNGSWNAWSRCPKGPPTSFVEPDPPYDPIAGAAAFETYHAFAAVAETRAELAEACFAAAAAYRNAVRRPKEIA